MKPWIAKRLFGQDRLLAASFPAPILTDAHTIVYYLRKKLSRDALQRKLGDERLQKAVAAMRKHAPEFPCLDRLATRIEEWRVEAQTVGFVADKYYDAERATSYTARLLNFGKGSKRRKVDEGDNCRTTEMDANSGASSGAFASGGSGGSQAALARLCVACCEWSGGRAAKMRSQPEPTGANKGGYLVADFGCGTGLSSGFFPDRSFVLGLDASRAMLEQFPQSLGDAIHTDLSQGIPLRPGVLDGAISVACVHYLCTPGPDGRAAEARVCPLIRYRIPNNNFCYQVFRHGDLDSAEKVADFFVDVAERENPSCTVVRDFPHRKRAERVFIAGQGKWLGEVDFERSKAMLDRQSATDDSLKSGAAPPGGRGLPSASTANGKASATAATAPEPTSPSKVTAATLRDQQKVLFPRLTEEASDADFEEVGKGEKLAKEVGFKYLGKEPTSYGDWSHKGRVTDF
eukprot:g3849.t1